ncbi:MAG: apolipoprotein N-acyltransferase [Treponema sp.]|nr:apolipoprotein N-acyltransferase [Treponema sp.]
MSGIFKLPAPFSNALMVLAGAVLFSASFPNLLFPQGLPFLAWIAYVPVFLVVRRSSLGASFFWGALYGYGAYCLFNYWLFVFNPLAGLVASLLYLGYMALLFPLLRLALILFPRRGYLLQFLLWMAYEYIRTLGFLGYSYGVTGYSQWSFIPLIQIASITGVWGVSALVVFPSAFLASALAEEGFFRRERLSACVWVLLLGASLVYGLFFTPDYSGAPTFKAALIQHNTDPWEANRAETPLMIYEAYRQDLRVLRRLSNEALQARPDTDLVVWSETAFVPRIYWHSTYRTDPSLWMLVQELLEYLAVQEHPFIIGNDDGRRDPVLNPNPDQNHMVNFNGALLFEGAELREDYRKMHLVPFTEHFPYQHRFPRIYQALVQADAHFWERGTDLTVFQTGGVKFSTPICFEDTFGYLSRDFVLQGAEVLVNLSNDVWAQSLPSQMQHLGMAVFRAVENRRSMVRSTSSGQSAGIDPAGRILSMAPPFTETWILAEVPVVRDSYSFYTLHGDYLGRSFIWAALLMLISGLLWGTIKHLSWRRKA